LGLLLLLSLTVPVLAQSDDQPGSSPIVSSEEPIPTLEPGAQLRPGISLPTDQDMAATADAIKQAAAEEQAALETPEAVQEREASQHAYENLTPAEAEELLKTKFADVLAGLNNDPSRFLSDAELDRPLGETAAQVTSDGTTSVMEGVLPVRTEDDKGDLSKVDLGLEETSEGFVPANPLVEVAIDSSVEEGVEVGDEGLTISQAGVEETDARPLGDKNVFFGEVDEGGDTDLLVSPISGGVELFDMLRSVDSPETLRFQVETPAGAELRQTPSGGAEVVGEDGSMLAEVPAPRAVDAQGRMLPVTLAVEGSTIVLSVEHRKEEVAYPVLVDPEVIDNWYYSFYNNQSLWTLGAWGYQESQNGWLHHGTEESMWPGHGGLFFASQPGGLPASQWGQYLFSAPNANSYFERGVLVPFWRNNRQCSAPNPYSEPYDYDGMWYAGHWNESSVNLPDFNQANQLGYAELSWGQTVIFGVSTSNGASIPCWRDFGMMGLQLWLNDWDYPYISAVSGSPSGWVKKGTNFTITAEATDGGLGVQSVRAFGVGTPEWGWNQGWCAGTYESPCGNNRAGQITIATSGFPYEGRYNGEGKERTYSVQVIDPTDKRWSLDKPLWLDGTPPVISLKGQLATSTDEVGTTEKPQETAAKDDELSLPTYKLEIEAKDGSDRSGVKEIKVFLDGKTTPEEVKAGSCGTNCPENLVMNYTLKLPGLSPGKHSLRIVAVDKVGNESDPNRNIEFEYIPATGMKEEYVLQHFRLPDGHDYSGEDEYHGPEIAVNVMNGNVVFHERDADVETERAQVELERVYNSQQPTQKDTQWGRGWGIAQAPELEPQAGSSPPQKATVTQNGKITSSVPIPQTQSQTTFSSRLRATITKTAGGYEVEPTTADEATMFNSSGRVEEVVEGDNTPVYLNPEEGEPATPTPPTYTSAFGSVGTAGGQFKHPAGIAIDAAGNLWVVDQENDRVEKFSGTGEYLSSFGTAGTGDGQFGRPTDIAIDAAGNLWVTDAGNNRVEKFNSKGEFLAKYGSYGTGNGQFNAAESIAIDAKGNIWVGDTYNARLQKFNSNFEFIKAVGSRGSGQGQLIESTGIDIGPGGNVWVADWGNNRVSVFNENGEFVRQFGSSGTGNGQFSRPDVIEVDSKGNVWVGDQNNGRVQEFNQNGEYITQFGTKGSGAGQFSFGWPMGIASDTKGNLWVSDTGNNRVQRWQIPGYVPTYNSAFGSAGTGTGQFSHPAGIAVDGAGGIWVVDQGNYRVEKFNGAGEYQSSFGSFGTGNGQFSRPTDIAIDAAGNLWVTDAGNSRVEKFTPKGEFLAKYGSYGTGNGQFSSAESIAIDAKGNIWVGDTYNARLQKFNSNFEFIKAVGTRGSGQGQLIEPTGIDIAPNGNVWVADWGNNRVSVFNENGEFVRQFGSSGTGTGQFSRPDVIEVDGKGNVWVGDQNNGRVQEFNQSGEFLTQFGAPGSGQGQFSFGWPMGIASDSKGKLWVADTGNNRVQQWGAADSVGGAGGGGLAPYFKAPVVAYEYSEGKLTGMQLEDEATKGEDPSLDMALSAGVVSEVESEEAGDTAYGYETGKLKTVSGSDGQTKYGYDASGRLNSVTLPNGTTATIVYDTTSRATSVTVDPAGPEVAKTTKFSYSAEPRRTIVWGGGNPEITYDIGEDGSVFKWQWAETPPTIASISGSLWAKKGEEIENKNHTLFVTGSSPHEVASIKVVENGNAVVAESTCEDKSEPPAHNCDQPPPLEWITHASEHAPGRMDLEVIVTDFLGHQVSERFYVIVPQQPPPGPEVVERPNFNSIKLFREEFGLDRNKPLTQPQMNELILELLYDWERRDETAMRAVEGWGIPMRAPELEEMEWRRQFVDQAAEAIPQWAEEHAPSSYGGFYVDERAGSKIYVGFTENQAALVESLKQSGVLINPNQVYPYPVPPPRSISSLEGTEDSIATAIAGNSSVRQATVFTSVAPEGNVVEVGATNPALVDSFLKQQFGQNAPISVVAENPGVRLFTRFEQSGPLYAGSGIVNNAGTAGCTAGWSARAPDSKAQGKDLYKYFVLTAGHCFSPNEGVARQFNRSALSGNPFGVVRRRDFAPEGPNDKIVIDAEAVSIDDSMRSHSVLNGSPMVPQPIQGTVRPRIRRTVCWSGVWGGQHCGKIIRKLRSPTGVGDTEDFTFLVNGPAAEGDSGGPVWDRDTHKAVGLITIGLGNFWITNSGVRMFERMTFTPLLPRPNESVPQGVIPKLGVDVLSQG
jgi:YD repeat-containing protein